MSARSLTCNLPAGPPPTGLDEPNHTPPAAAVARASVSLDHMDVAVSALSGHFGDGVDVSVMTATARSTQQQTTLEAKLFGAQTTSANGHWTTSSDLMSAKFNYGTQNADGSVGGNFGLGATVIGTEVTYESSGSSLTLGLSEGVGAELSIGVRDKDEDGLGELCGRVAAGPFTVGLCLEAPSADEGRAMLESIP
jgi:hypothetical protein